jgi:tRNA U34 5-carboxymethylaminomethyl modifying GTPase MnmE/TrmE
MKEIKIKQLNEQGLQLLQDAFQAVQGSTASAIREFEPKIPRHLSDPDKKVYVVFAGEYSAGKSSILKELTGKDLRIGGGITTEQLQELDWNDLILVDTPGIHTQKRPDHDAITYDAIAKADLIIFVITNQGFDDHLGNHFRKLLIDKGKGNEMMLVVNQMDNCGNTQSKRDVITKNDILPVILPQFEPQDLYLTFVSSKAYREAELEKDPDEKAFLLKEANLDFLVDQINRFVRDKGLIGRLTTPLYELEQVLNEIIDTIPKDNPYADRMEHLLNQQRRALVKSRKEVRDRIHVMVEEKVSLIAVLGNEIANLLTTDAKEDDINKAIAERYEKVNQIYAKALQEAEKIVRREMEDLQAEFERIHTSSFAQTLKRDLEMASVGGATGSGTTNAQKAKRVADWVNKGGSAAAKWATNGSKVTGWESFFKLGTYSASKGHKAILAIGHFFGYQFKPWEAVNLAAKIGKVGRVLGGVGAVAGFVLDIWLEHKKKVNEEKVKEARYSILSSFLNVSEVVRKNIEDGTEKWLQENIDTQIEETDKKLQELRDMSESSGADLDEFTALLKRTRSLIIEFHN